MEVIDHGVVRKTLYLLLQLQVLINRDLKTTSHFLIIDLVFLPSHLLLVQIYDIFHSGTDIQLKPLVHSLFDHFHFLHHQSFLFLTAFHVVDSGLLDAVHDFLFRGLVDVVQDLQLCSICICYLPLVYICWIEGLFVVYKVAEIVSRYCHFVVVRAMDIFSKKLMLLTI